MRLSSLLTLLVLSCLLLVPSVSARDVTVFAAASLKGVLDEVLTAYRRDTGNQAVAAYAGSSALAKQILSGAPADIFISADQEWMDHLAKGGLIQSDSRVTFLGNQLVLVTQRAAARPLKIDANLDIDALLGDQRLAVANLESVPAGRYAKAALTHLGLWSKVKDRTAPTENVRAALALVARGEAAAGIVYATDARAEPGVAIVGIFPADSHPPIQYPIALTSTADPAARALLEYLLAAETRRWFTNEGFKVLAP